MSSLSTTTNSGREWAGCTPGEIGHMVQRLKTRRFLSMVRRDATVLTALFACLFSGYFYFGILPETQMDLGGIYCYQVQPLAEQLLSGQLDSETRHKVERHIRYCEHCRRHIETVRLEAIDHGPDVEHNWDKARNPEIVAQRDSMRVVLPVTAANIID